MSLIHKQCSMKTGLNIFAKSIGPRQPAHPAQADMGRYFSPSLNFLLVKRTFYIIIWFVCLTKWSLWVHNQVMPYLVSWTREIHEAPLYKAIYRDIWLVPKRIKSNHWGLENWKPSSVFGPAEPDKLYPCLQQLHFQVTTCCGFEFPTGRLKLLIVFQMRR